MRTSPFAGIATAAFPSNRWGNPFLTVGDEWDTITCRRTSKLVLFAERNETVIEPEGRQGQTERPMMSFHLTGDALWQRMVRALAARIGVEA